MTKDLNQSVENTNYLVNTTNVEEQSSICSIISLASICENKILQSRHYKSMQGSLDLFGDLIKHGIIREEGDDQIILKKKEANEKNGEQQHQFIVYEETQYPKLVNFSVGLLKQYYPVNIYSCTWPFNTI